MPEVAIWEITLEEGKGRTKFHIAAADFADAYHKAMRYKNIKSIYATLVGIEKTELVVPNPKD